MRLLLHTAMRLFDMIFPTGKVKFPMQRYGDSVYAMDGTPPAQSWPHIFKATHWDPLLRHIMSSRLELIPLDVLTHIAFYTVDPAPTSALDAILALLLSCRHLHRLLAVESCPQLYALIFHDKFDLRSHARRDTHCTRTTCLASELRVRRRVLRRIRHSQVLGQHILGDLWTTYLMLLESDGLNELQLHTAGVGDWVLRVLGECQSSDTDQRMLSLAAAVACLVLSHSNPRSDSIL